MRFTSADLEQLIQTASHAENLLVSIRAQVAEVNVAVIQDDLQVDDPTVADEALEIQNIAGKFLESSMETMKGLEVLSCLES